MSGTKRKLPVLLIISLCFNAALLGGAGAGFLNASHHKSKQEQRGPGGPDNGGGPFEERLVFSALQTMSADDRKAFRKALSKEWRNTRGEREEMDAARLELVNALKADDFDRAAIQAAFEKLRGFENNLRERMHNRLVDLLADMDPAQRKTLVESVTKRGMGPPDGPPGKNGPPDRMGGPPDGPPPEFGGMPPDHSDENEPE